MKYDYETLKTIVVVALIAGAAYVAANSRNDWGWFLFFAWMIW